MRIKLLLLLLLLITACGKYDHLKPNPSVVPQESEYIMLSKKDKNFEIEPDKKYYIEFPAPQSDDFVVAFKFPDGTAFDQYFSPDFDKKVETPDTKIPDQAPSPTVAAYNVNTGFEKFYWVIENAREKTQLRSDYRYMTRWRFNFETKYEKMQEKYRQNIAARDRFDALGSGGFYDFQAELNLLNAKTAVLKSVSNEMPALEAILPLNIKSSGDAAFTDFIDLKRDVDTELIFHEDFRIALTALQFARGNRLDNELFIRNLPEVMKFFENQDRYPQNIQREVADAVASRLTEIVPYYENEVRKKSDLSKIDFPVETARNLYRRTNQQPDARFNEFTQFVSAFNSDLANYQAAKTRLNEFDNQLRGEQWPTAATFRRVAAQLNSVSTPSFSQSSYGKYGSYSIVQKLRREINGLSDKIRSMRNGLGTAESLAEQINNLKDRGDYRAIIRLIKQNSDISFLQDLYGNLDQRSIDQQSADIRSALNAQNFADAERRIRALYQDRDFIDYNSFSAKKLSLSKQFEEELLQAVEKTSKDRVNQFVAANSGAIDNVDALYNSPAFQPAHIITFSAGGANVVAGYNQRLQTYLENLKTDQFPKESIQTIYNDFVNNPSNNGVAKARAIITHGKNYKGDDRRTKNMVAEINPEIPKWVTKATEYRRVFVLPTNASQQATNTYKFKINLQIPSDATFPVYDVNIKLPREVAGKANQEQWYKSIKLNGELLKNEGRFRITAPTERNGFESQITPLQVKKDGSNVLEVEFNYSAFKVLEVSVMAQRPIIRRD